MVTFTWDLPKFKDGDYVNIINNMFNVDGECGKINEGGNNYDTSVSVFFFEHK